MKKILKYIIVILLIIATPILAMVIEGISLYYVVSIGTFLGAIAGRVWISMSDD